MKTLDDKEKQYSKFLNYRKQPANNFKRTFTALFLVFAVTVVAAFCYFFDFKNPKNTVNNIKNWYANINNKDESMLANRESLFDLFHKKQNILLLGVDVNYDGSDPFKGSRSDTIMILNLDPRNKTVNLVSIPRDSKVYIAEENGINKINSAHALGGVELTKKTIENTFGVRIDNYIVINTAGIKKAVDAVGGVPLYVEKDMHYHDYAGGLHVDLNKGENVLNGKQAEGYLRFRHDAMGDISRTTRQQWFLKALLAKLQTKEGITKIPSLLKIASEYVKTDLSLYEMSHLVALLRNIDDSKVEFATLPGAPSQRGYVSYWILDPEKTQEIFDRMIYRTTPKEVAKPTVAGILYTQENMELAMQLKQILKAEGYNVKCVSRTRLPHTQIIGHNKTVSADFVKWLKKQSPELKKAQFVYNPQDVYCPDNDFTIVIANI